MALGTLGGAPPAFAKGVRPLFEPTDLEMEEGGVIELDLQLGGIRSRGPWRVVIPDFELDVGLLPYLELDINGGYAIEGPATGPFAFDHAVPDSLWPSLKLGILDWHDHAARRGFALGVQLGPKLPVASGSHGIGCEGLLLLGHMRGPLRMALNLGAFADPAPDAVSGRPLGIEGGLDVEIVLDQATRYALLGEISGVRFLSDDPHQLLATAGFKWAATPWLDLSLIGLWGFIAGSDRYGVLLGVSPKVQLWGRKPAEAERLLPG